MDLSENIDETNLRLCIGLLGVDHRHLHETRLLRRVFLTEPT